MDQIHQDTTISIDRFFEINNDACLLFAGNSCVVRTNRISEVLFGFETGALSGKKFGDLVCKPLGSLEREINEHLRANPSYRDQVVGIHNSGETLNLELEATYVNQANPNCLLVILRESQKIDPANNDMVRQLAFKAFVGQVATGVLHNVGNLLNSINVTAQNLLEIARDANIDKLLKANALFMEHRRQIQTFIDSHPTGRYLPEFYEEFGHLLDRDNKRQRSDLTELQENLNLIKELIATQQDYARNAGGAGQLHLLTLINDVLRLEMMSFNKHSIQLEIDVPENLYLRSWRGKIMHVLLNLVKNAKEAILADTKHERLLMITAEKVDGRVMVRIKDNGIGIKGEHLARMFGYGFTTKLEGHGFGLYTSIEAVREMNGELRVQSDGPGTGAEFVLELPAVKGETGF